MRYLSTRGNAPAQSFSDILLGGLAPDGGLYLPESYPQITRAELDAWRTLSYAELAFAILSKFIDDIPAADLKAICDKTYTAEVYCNAPSSPHAATGHEAAARTGFRRRPLARRALSTVKDDQKLARATSPTPRRRSSDCRPCRLACTVAVNALISWSLCTLRQTLPSPTSKVSTLSAT